MNPKTLLLLSTSVVVIVDGVVDVEFSIPPTLAVATSSRINGRTAKDDDADNTKVVPERTNTGESRTREVLLLLLLLLPPARLL